ncbi:SusD family protein [bacterium A37T11]|nr:SusD family protein [bacterium A37T11]
MKAQKILLGMFLFLSLVSCSKWIDVKPSDRLSEEMVFTNQEGFLKALNGVYVELANTSLYGQSMTAAEIDVMAQYYYINSSTNPYYYFTMFNYTTSSTKTSFDNVWKKAYELIANCNVIIEKCGDSNAVLPAPYFGIVKGEALALRALLHFDMLRLFGPIWSEENKTVPSIPYVTTTGSEVSPLLTAQQVIENVVADLNAARVLLQDSDPVITEGVRNTANSSGSNDLYYRQYRFNYYAVKALLARVYLWEADKTNALNLAKEIISEVQVPGKEIFPFVSNAAATQSDKPDRMFSSEVLFSLYTINRVTMYNTLFSAQQEQYARLSFNAGNSDNARVNELYDDDNDYRYRIWENVNVEGASVLTNQKYKDYTDAPGRYMIPLIRLSELYLIAAECTDELTEGISYLNEVRTSRNCFSLSPTSLDELNTAITTEFRKETIGEGQMFFYYKRHAMQTIPNNAGLTGTKTMVLSNYVVPLPDSEISLRN